MFTPSANRPRRAGRRGFTLLEVMVAVLVISMLMISVFRFVKSVLLAVQVSTDVTMAKQETAGLIDFLQTQLEDLPPMRTPRLVLPAGSSLTKVGTGTLNLTGNKLNLTGNNTFGPPLQPGSLNPRGGVFTATMGQAGVLTGTSHQYNELPADEMEWICPAGHGVLTTAASGEYRVTLAIQNVKGKSGDYEIGLRRRTIESDERTYDWLPLLRPATALEIRYFEPRGKQWIDAWKDPMQRPALVRVRVWRKKTEPPVEAVLPLPTARM